MVCALQGVISSPHHFAIALAYDCVILTMFPFIIEKWIGNILYLNHSSLLHCTIQSSLVQSSPMTTAMLKNRRSKSNWSDQILSNLQSCVQWFWVWPAALEVGPWPLVFCARPTPVGLCMECFFSSLRLAGLCPFQNSCTTWKKKRSFSSSVAKEAKCCLTGKPQKGSRQQSLHLTNSWRGSLMASVATVSKGPHFSKAWVLKGACRNRDLTRHLMAQMFLKISFCNFSYMTPFGSLLGQKLIATKKYDSHSLFLGVTEVGGWENDWMHHTTMKGQKTYEKRYGTLHDGKQ